MKRSELKRIIREEIARMPHSEYRYTILEGSDRDIFRIIKKYGSKRDVNKIADTLFSATRSLLPGSSDQEWFYSRLLQDSLKRVGASSLAAKVPKIFKRGNIMPETDSVERGVRRSKEMEKLTSDRYLNSYVDDIVYDANGDVTTIIAGFVRSAYYRLENHKAVRHLIKLGNLED